MRPYRAGARPSEVQPSFPCTHVEEERVGTDTEMRVNRLHFNVSL